MALIPLRQVFLTTQTWRLDCPNSVSTFWHLYASLVPSMVRARLGSSVSISHAGSTGQGSSGVGGNYFLDKTSRGEGGLAASRGIDTMLSVRGIKYLG